jgi:hypothetical protein
LLVARRAPGSREQPIRGARVIDGRARLSAPQDVLSGKKDCAGGPRRTCRTTGIRVVDGHDGFLLPGFIDLGMRMSDDVLLQGWPHNGVTTVRDIASQAEDA